ncbi:MAG: hypothetical protein QOD97_1105, partial [Mycobacterium sp.]|nr:hypothetical protein [Mycobacterium sp.]
RSAERGHEPGRGYIGLLGWHGRRLLRDVA